MKTQRSQLVELLHGFARRVAKEQGVSDPRVKLQLGVINGLAKEVLGSKAVPVAAVKKEKADDGKRRKASGAAGLRN